MKARDFDKKFDVWMVESLDREASRLGVSQQSLIKMLIVRHLDESHPV